MHPLSNFSQFLKHIDKFLEKCVILLLTPIFFVFVLSFGLLFNILRQVSIISAKLFKNGTLLKPLTTTSALVANCDDIYKKPWYTIVTCLILEGVPDIDKIRDVIKRQILEKVDSKTGKWFYPELLQNISYHLGYPFWTKLEHCSPDWLLKECVHFYNNDETTESNFQMLENIIKELSLTPFSKDKPLMETIIVPNFTPDPEKNAGLLPDKKYFVLILRCHHSLADGIAISKLLQNMSINTAPNKFEYIVPQDYTKKSKLEKRNMFTKLCNTLILSLTIIFKLTEFLFNQNMLSSKTLVWPPNKEKSIASRTSKCSSVNRRLQNLNISHAKPFNLSEVNEIKRIYGVSGTSVLFAGVIGAVRKTLFGRYDTIPENIGVSVILPLPGHVGKLRNKFTMGWMYLPIDNADSVERLLKIQKKIDTIKKSPLPLGISILITFVFGAWPRCITYFGQMIFSQTEFVSVSNMPGPKNMFDIVGYPVRDFVIGSAMPIEKRTPFVAISSIGGRVKICVTSDSSVIMTSEQSEEFNENFFKELEILKNTYN